MKRSQVKNLLLSLKDSTSPKNQQADDPIERDGLMGWSLLEPEQAEDLLHRETCEATHLYVLVHGFNSMADHLKYLGQQLLNRLGPSAVVHATRCNEAKIQNPFLHPTHDGIDTCGERLAVEIREVVQKHSSLKYISMVGNSMGGLFCRYALGLLFDPATGLVAGLTPVTYMTTCTPHLGVRSLLPKTMHNIAGFSSYGGRSVKHLLLEQANSTSPFSPTRGKDLKRWESVQSSGSSGEDEGAGKAASIFESDLFDDGDAWVGGARSREESAQRAHGAEAAGSDGGQGRGGSSPSPASQRAEDDDAAEGERARSGGHEAGERGREDGDGAGSGRGAGGGGRGGGGRGESGSPTVQGRRQTLWLTLGLPTLRRERSTPTAMPSAQGEGEGEGRGVPPSPQGKGALRERMGWMRGKRRGGREARDRGGAAGAGAEEGEPLLVSMTTDSERPYMAALGAFRFRVAYGNTCNDMLVRYQTACIAQAPLPGWQTLSPIGGRYPHIISDTQEQEPGPFPAAVPAGEAYFAGDAREAEVGAMMANLSSLAWRRVSVRFERTVKIGEERKALPGFLAGLALDAHNRVPVVRPLIDGDGVDTVNHLCDVLLEHAKAEAGPSELAT